MDEREPEDVDEQRKNNVGGITGKGFMPGQSGNPGGRPKGTYSLKTRLEKLLQEQQFDGRDRGEHLMDAIIKAAFKGNGTAIKEILNRIDGPVKEEVDVNMSVGKVVVDC